jgi:hypothetical protein
MPIPYESQFPLCDFCGKPELPPGTMIIYYSTTTESRYCEGHTDRVCCPHCGCMVHVRMHPFRACQYFHQMYDTSAELRVDEVLDEAEAILREAHSDGRWEGAE